MTYGRALSTLAVVAATVGGAAAPAHAAVTTNYPTAAQARTFATTDGGWTATTANSGVCIICPTSSGTHEPTGGAGGVGDGYLRDTFATGVGVLSASTVTYTSPSFTPAGPIERATLSAKVRTQLSSILSLLSNGATLTAKLNDVAQPGDSTTFTAQSLTSGAGFTPISLPIPDGALVAGRTYTLSLAVRVSSGVAAVVQNGTVDLDDVSVAVSDLQAPDGLTASVSTSGGITVAGTVDPHGQATAVDVQFGATAAYGGTTAASVVNGAGAQAFSIPLAGLTPGATYHYRARATNADGTEHTNDATFVVPSVPGNSAPSIQGDLNSRTRTVIYDQVPGTTAVRIELLLDDNVTVYSTTPDPDLDGTATITLPSTDGVYFVRVVRDGLGGGSSTSDGVSTQLDRVGPANAAAPVVTGNTNARGRHVHFDRASDATSARVEILTTGGTVLSSEPVTAGGDLDITLPDTDGTYLVRVIQTDAANNPTTSPSTIAQLIRGTIGTGGEDPGGPTNPTDDGTGPGTGVGTGTAPGTGTGTTSSVNDPGNFSGLLTSCYGNGKVALIDVRTTAKMVKFAGIAALPAGTTVKIVDKAGKAVKTAKVGANGRFGTSIKRPKAKVLRTSRYAAVVGATKSTALKPTRIASVSNLTVSGTTATLTGKVDPRKLKGKSGFKFAARGGRGGTACATLGGGKLTTIGKLKLSTKTGRFKVKVKVPGTGPVAVRVAFSGGVRTATLYAVR